jgi:hypothetical protein
MVTASDESGCDMDKPVGFWVRQTRSSGETLAVKVRYDQADGQVQGATIGGNSESNHSSGKMDEPEA